MSDEFAEARKYWQGEMDRIGPDWDNAEIIASFAGKQNAQLTADLARVTAERDALRTALEHYADERTWNHGFYFDGSTVGYKQDYSVCDFDGYIVAQAAINGNDVDGMLAFIHEDNRQYHPNATLAGKEGVNERDAA